MWKMIQFLLDCFVARRCCSQCGSTHLVGETVIREGDVLSGTPCSVFETQCTQCGNRDEFLLH